MEYAERCLCSDRAGLEKCTETGKPYSYRCHMGLSEILTHITSGVESCELLREFFEDELLGFTDVKNVYSAPTDIGGSLLAPFTKKYPLSLSDTHPLIKTKKPTLTFLQH